LPFVAELITPKIEDTFWVNLLGKGYPAPTQMFRWCTERIKIRPADDFILNKVANHGEVILLLGVRREESVSRSQGMELRKIKNSILSRHTKYPQAYVYTPVEDFTVDDIWSFLLQVNNPWGDDNKELLALYRGPNDGECPLVIDKSSASCGNSRFGCWTCTLVKEDKTLRSLIEAGDEWLRPLLKIRELLYKTTIPENKHLYRELKSRTGFVRKKHDGTGLSRGPYTLKFMKELMTLLLQAQKSIELSKPGTSFKVITEHELFLIRELWIKEKKDWQDSLPKLYKKIMNKDLDWKSNDWGVFSLEESKILSKICEKDNVSTDLVMELFNVERMMQGMTRRSAITTKIDRVLNKEWRDEKDIIEEFENNKEGANK